ncbi:MAG: GmrSD restriction endonuclease domain-containing protein [Actinomycetota bacterium]
MENVYTIGQIFSERLLIIPDYQRGYAWERQNLVEFTDDLEMLPPDRNHYTGTVILDQSLATRRRDAAGRLYEIVDVVDGQQRRLPENVAAVLRTIADFHVGGRL